MAAIAVKQQVAANWERAILVCGKCSKRIGGGFGPKRRTALVKLLRRQPGCGRKRKARVGVVEVPCLGLCPKGAVVVLDTACPHDWLLVRPGADAGELLARLGNPAVIASPAPAGA